MFVAAACLSAGKLYAAIFKKGSGFSRKVKIVLPSPWAL